jgi:photosystem II stability/assembly factor-like uncharacterized protein
MAGFTRVGAVLMAAFAVACAARNQEATEDDPGTSAGGDSAVGDAAPIEPPPVATSGGGGVMATSDAAAPGVTADSGASTSHYSGKWINVTNNLAGLPTHVPCGNLSSMCQVPGRDSVIVAVANGGNISAKGGLYATQDGGATWKHMGTGPGSDVIDNNPYAITFDPDNPDIFWESGQYGKWGVYKTTDGGSTFHHLALPAYTSQTAVDFTDPERETIVVGSVETSNTVWKSTDGGMTWSNIGTNLPAGTNFSTDPVVIDANTYLVVCSGWGKGTNGTYRTTDGGKSWALVSKLAGNYPVLLTSDNAMYWALPWNNGLIKSTDMGVTWKQLVGYNVLTPNTPIELEDQRLVAVGTKQQLLVSSDQGTTWTSFLDPLPIEPKAEGRYAVLHDAIRNSYFVSKWDCQTTMPTDAIWRYDAAP